MSHEDAGGSLVEEESEREYVERKTKEYVATRERNIRKLHFDYSRRRWFFSHEILWFSFFWLKSFPVYPEQGEYLKWSVIVSRFSEYDIEKTFQRRVDVQVLRSPFLHDVEKPRTNNTHDKEEEENTDDRILPGQVCKEITFHSRLNLLYVMRNQL